MLQWYRHHSQKFRPKTSTAEPSASLFLSQKEVLTVPSFIKVMAKRRYCTVSLKIFGQKEVIMYPQSHLFWSVPLFRFVWGRRGTAVQSVIFFLAKKRYCTPIEASESIAYLKVFRQVAWDRSAKNGFMANVIVKGCHTSCHNKGSKHNTSRRVSRPRDEDSMGINLSNRSQEKQTSPIIALPWAPRFKSSQDKSIWDLTPLQPEARFFYKILGISIGRNLGALNGLRGVKSSCPATVKFTCSPQKTRALCH